MGARNRPSTIAGARQGAAIRTIRAGFPHSNWRFATTVQRGFSLIEMVAVIVLIAITLSFVTISFSRIFAGAKIQAASRDLVAALRYTRGQAIVKGKQTTFDLDLANNSYKAPDKGVVQLPKTMRLNLYTAEQEQTSDTSGSIRFFPDGASTGGHISVLMDRVEWRINVDWLTGAITREELRQ